MLYGDINQNKRKSLRGEPWRSSVIPQRKEIPSLWIRGVRWRDEGQKKRKEKKEKERNGKKGKVEIILLVFGLSTRREEKRERGVRSSTFSVRFTEIKPSVLVRAKGKVHLRDKSFA